MSITMIYMKGLSMELKGHSLFVLHKGAYLLFTLESNEKINLPEVNKHSD